MTNISAQQRLQLFANEINDIKNDLLREFAIQLLLNAPQYFFIVPASSSGKYHPYFAREEGGLVKHTRCVVFYAECNAESFNLNEHDKDLIIISALVHDIKKQGNGDNGKYTVWEHPELAHDFVLEMQTKYPHLISTDDAQIIANAVICHMGKWAHNKEFTKTRKQYPMPNTLFEYALQSADYIASRTELTGFAFRDNINIQINTTQPINECKQNEKNVGDEVFTFGKHNGKTIKEVVENYLDYINWIINQPNFKNVDMLEKIKMYINT